MVQISIYKFHVSEDFEFFYNYGPDNSVLSANYVHN